MLRSWTWRFGDFLDYQLNCWLVSNIDQKNVFLMVFMVDFLTHHINKFCPTGLQWTDWRRGWPRGAAWGDIRYKRPSLELIPQPFSCKTTARPVELQRPLCSASSTCAELCIRRMRITRDVERNFLQNKLPRKTNKKRNIFFYNSVPGIPKLLLFDIWSNVRDY